MMVRPAGACVKPLAGARAASKGPQTCNLQRFRPEIPAPGRCGRSLTCARLVGQHG